MGRDPTGRLQSRNTEATSPSGSELLSFRSSSDTPQGAYLTSDPTMVWYLLRVSFRCRGALAALDLQSECQVVAAVARGTDKLGSNALGGWVRG